MVRKYFPKRQWGNAIRVASAENGKFNPKAVNYNHDKVKSIDTGLFMCNDYWHYKAFGFKTKKSFREALKNPDYNVMVASEIWRGGGWNQWSVVSNGHASIN